MTSLVPKPYMPCGATAVLPCSPQNVGRALDGAFPMRDLWDPASPEHVGAAAGPDLGVTLGHPEHSPHHWSFEKGVGSFLFPKLPLSVPGAAQMPWDNV